jgi:hypothetical protein
MVESNYGTLGSRYKALTMVKHTILIRHLTNYRHFSHF